MARRGPNETADGDTEAPIVCAFCGRGEGSVDTLIAGPSVYICDACVRECVEILHRDRAMERALSSLPSPRSIHAFLDHYVIGQQYAKRVLSVAVHNHFKRLRAAIAPGGPDIHKSNVLLLGPTGCGKTLLVETLARMLEVPLVIVDASSFTEAGYAGEGVEAIAVRLLRAARDDVALAGRGIVYLDEIDKLAVRRAGAGHVRDIGGEGVQQALLRLMEGRTVAVDDRHGDAVEVDTRDVLFIAGGAFNGLERIVRERGDRTGMGFAVPLEAPRERCDHLLPGPEPEDLMRFGFIPELVGRLPVTAMLDALTERDLVRLLTEPCNAPVRQYRELLRMEGCDLTFTAGALRAIAREAMALGGGARSLRSVLERVLLDPMFDAGGTCAQLRVDARFVGGVRERRRLTA